MKNKLTKNIKIKKAHQTERQILEGSRVISEVINNIKPAVISAYPITPQTHIVEDLAKLKADGLAGYEYVRAESEFAAASIVLGASATGVRTYSATSSQGLLLMTEVVYNIAGLRLPVVMTCANRAVSSPINIWCFSSKTEVLMADLTYKPIDKVGVGEKVIGKDKKGNIVYSTVTKLFSRYAEGLIKLKAGETEITCTPEHQFYCRSGYGHWIKAKNLEGKNLHYFGHPKRINNDFKRGWLTGVADGDGSFYAQGNSRAFRLKCKDQEMADTFAKWSNEFGYPVRKPKYMEKFGYFLAIMTLTKETVKFKKFLIKKDSEDFARGYLAGIYDAEGSGPFKVKQATIYNNKTEIVETVSKYLELLNIKFKVYKDARRGGYYKNDNYHIKINNVPEFFIKCPPIISRKRENLLKMTLKSIKSRLKIEKVTSFYKKTKVYNIETETNNYVADGLLVHNCDHSDVMSVRDAGWIQLFASNHQEAVHAHILAYKIAEELKLPVMVNVDGYILTHSYEPVIIPSAKTIKKFLPDYRPQADEYLNPKKPMTFGSFFGSAYYLEVRAALHDDLRGALKIINQETKLLDTILKTAGITAEPGALISSGLIEYSGPKNPTTILVALGSVIGTIKEVLKTNKQTGVLKIKVYRPFPGEEIVKIISRAKNVAVIEKAISLGQAGPLYSDLKSALSSAEAKSLNIRNYIVGLGGRDVTEKMIKSIIADAGRKNPEPKFVG
jgi:pyruvate/2-oxoacid:ferredoxin oxidoreductase alpha subunit